MKDWQRLMLRTAGAAAGATAALAAVAIVLFWYGSRPKSWDDKAITCVSASARAVYDYIPATRTMKASGFSLKFALANNTRRDYTIPVNVKVFKRQASTQALEPFDAKVDNTLVIPAHDRAQFAITVDYGCGVSNLDTGRETERDESTCYHDSFMDVKGFVVLDEENKIRFDLPKPTLVTVNDQKPSNGNTPDHPAYELKPTAVRTSSKLNRIKTQAVHR